MATENYNVKVQVQGARQLEKLNSSTIRIQNSLGGLGTAAKLAGGAIAAIGAARIGRSFLNTARQMETLEQRFGFLFGTAREGARAFEELTEFAGTVPFSLEEIANASGVLAVVSDNAEELRTNLELTGNVAAVTGLGFQVAGEQIQRALSGGIGAADLLREKGVRNLLGFKDGVKVTAEETAEALQRTFGPDGEFGDAALALAGTFEGLTSMIDDKMTKIKINVMDAGPFDMLKAVIKALDEDATKNFGSIEEASKKIGEGITQSVKTAIVGGAVLLDELEPIFNYISKSYNNILRATDGLPTGIKFAGVIGFLMLGFKAKVITFFLGGIIDTVLKGIATVIDAVADATRFLGKGLDKIPGLGKLAKSFDETADSIDGVGDKVRDMMMKIKDPTDEVVKLNLSFIDTLKAQRNELGPNAQKALEYIERLEGIIAGFKKTEEKAKELEKAMGDNTETTNKAIISFENFKEKGIAALKKMVEEFDPMDEGVKLLISGFNRLTKGIGDAFADAILGAKSFQESISSLAKAIFRQLISGIIQIGLQVYVFDVMKRKLEGVEGAQKKVNSQLKREIGLRAVLSFFTGGIGIPGLADGGSAQKGQPYIVGERGPELFIPNTNGQVVPNEQLGMSEPGTGTGTGDVNINFNINTVDATGFDELLLSRRALITGIINEGVNRQGRRAIV